MLKSTCLFGLIVLACFLSGFGDLRNLITPLGYWLAWLGWALTVVTVIRPWLQQYSQFLSPFPRLVYLSFFILIAGMLLAGLSASQPTALYQALKVAVIAGLMGVTLLLIRQVRPEAVVDAIAVLLVAVLLSFWLSKGLGVPWWVRLGDGREGMEIAQPGVMWKPAVLFLPLVLADVLARPSLWWRHGCLIGISAYLLIVDGSRTGLLLFAGMIFVMAFLSLMLHWRGISLSLKWLLIAALSFGGINGVHSLLPGASPDVPNEIAIAPEPLALQRLQEGDASRLSLLKEGWRQSVDCLPAGCGFGSTAAVSHGIIMPVHNAYLAALGDFGLLGMIGMLGFVLAAAWPLCPWLRRARQVGFGALDARSWYGLGACAGALAWCATLMLHTFSSEMSEWGYACLLLAMAWVYCLEQR
ncbi:hypothetical protein AAV94_11590 [Lampropedia cohaerens]|uniref:Uncharacterized protein n=1 Tax=Lampropedia cohaerens TaxID=1610491 RepID=A0A0U1PXX5_9BURK|nr:hypothetical protein [Lampropedia cohaerens]KKW67225.1 hypothetical protein AAV94_11590 [Lampropedia cohaerens]